MKQNRSDRGAIALSSRAPLRILGLRTLDGPNLFDQRPLLALRLHLGDVPRSDSADSFAERLLLALPALRMHGDFADRLQRGLPLGDVVAAAAIVLSAAADIDAERGTSVPTDEPRVCHVVVRYRCEAGMRALLEGAVALVDALLADADAPPVSVHDIVANARRIVARHAPGPGTRAIIDAAQARGIPWRRLDTSGDLIRFGWGRSIRCIDATTTERTSTVAMPLARDRARVARRLQEARIVVPRGTVVHSAAAAIEALREFAPPLVFKPVSGPHRRGCSLRLTTPAEAAAAYARAALVDHRVRVEEQVRGRDYRVLIVGGRLAAASERVPARVVGDGRSSIVQLVERENALRRGRGRSEANAAPIAIDDALTGQLAGRGLWLDSVPGAGARVLLRESANLARGGTVTDVTGAVHPEIAALCVRAASVVGLDICGIDFVSPDIARAGAGGAIVEVQAGPDLDMHCRPSIGEPHAVGRAIIDMLYPPDEAGGDDRAGRIPLVSVAGGHGRSAVVQLARQWLAQLGYAVGGGADANSAHAVLGDRSVDMAVLEVAHSAVVRDGLGYDWADVGIVLRGTADDGSDRSDDTDALVAARVRRGGCLVLDADDDASARFATLPQHRGRCMAWFSRRADSPPVRGPLPSGHSAVWAEDGWVVAAHGGGRPPQRLIAIDALPSTGGADADIGHALAAVAACRALGVDAGNLNAAVAAPLPHAIRSA